VTGASVFWLFADSCSAVSTTGSGVVITPPSAGRERERLTPARSSETIMSSNDGGGLMSSAGLVRYFDAEDQNTIRIDPRTIVAFGAMFGFLVLILNTF